MSPLASTDHVGYTVSDLDRSVEFWAYFLERPPKARKAWNVPYLGRIQTYADVKIEAAFFDLPGELTLELIHHRNPPEQIVDMETYSVGNAHISFVITDLQQTVDRLRGHAELRSVDPVRIKWGPYEGGYEARVRDPDGIIIGLVQLPDSGVRL